MKYKNLNNQALPTLNEIQKLYEEILRNEVSNERDFEVESGEFFKNFRKYEEKQKISIKENKIIEKYRYYLKFEKNKQKKNNWRSGKFNWIWKVFLGIGEK